ncbi:hypothetical protein N7520_009940 [Penicillium odoratum]|uniref:uncharacterized protein n=1 Tax=Penicillium odoratum TaxID=1167516 RepID=UPI002548DB0C|nr:uncharacterized protein N7520_009940 [Penicillium odoratum]KAJ5753023.1 hypothetical protein N7520_009940 [Penicillium odoratum]
MADEQKPTNVEAEQDVQKVLNELKGENSEKAEEKPTEESAAKPADESTEKPAQEDSEEARIVAAAAKLGEKSEQSEQSGDKPKPQQEPRHQRTSRAKFDAASLQETDDPVEIRKQVEFYLSDSNLPLDKFLLSKVGGSANNAVPLELLHSFKRMRRFQPFSAIVEALKTAETVELVDNDTAVKRKVPLPESVTTEVNDEGIKVWEDKTMPRSIYAKGFGREEPSTQYDIEKFFETYGPINAIRLRRGDDRGFKGSVFVEFASEEKQQEFLALEPKPQWNGKDLIIKSKKQYCEEKVEEIKNGNVQPNRGARGGSRGGRGRGRGGRGARGGRGRGGRGGRNDRDWRERRDDDQKNGFQDRRQEKDSRGVPVVQSTGEKRSRDDEAGDRPAKKVDAKE